MYSAMRGEGVYEGFMEYINWYNACDWFTIFMGFLSAAIWFWVCVATQDVSLQKLVTQFVEGSSCPMGVGTAELQSIENAHDYIVNIMFWLRILNSLNMLSITLKFFKAFQ